MPLKRSLRATIALFVRRVRGRHLFVLDLIGITVASYAALSLRYDRALEVGLALTFAPVIALLLAVRTITDIKLGLYRHHWRFASIPDVTRIASAILLGSIVTAILFYGTTALWGDAWPPGFPRGFWVVEPLLSVCVVGGLRLGIRAASDLEPHPRSTFVADRRATLLYGAGHAGVLMARSARREPAAGINPVGFLDDDRSLAGGSVAGLRVFGGLGALERAVAKTGAQALLITMPSAPGSAVRRAVDAAMALGLEVRTVPAISDLLDGTLDAYRIRQLRVEDLLRRPLVTEHAAAVREILSDRTVMITGAAGSIGSELARQVLDVGPRRLVLVDRAESPLYLVQRELQTRVAHGRGSGELSVHLGNVVSRALMERLVETERPDVIFHAAAYKHVPMMEDHPSDAAHVNIGGTMVLLEAAVAAGVERFVFVSTDKAVRPSSVMGATKRIAEMLVADAARRTGRAYVSVRFGNVLGSAGSVVPLFQEQLEKGEPLTVTHPDMTRFFMTIPEAAWLILDAAALGRNGDLFVLDMGEPVRIMDLAHDLIRLAGRDPETQPIEFVGLRPGEKLHEELFYDAERVEPTASPKVMRAISEPPPVDVRDYIRFVLSLATGEDDAALRRELVTYAGDAGEQLRATDQAEGDSDSAGRLVGFSIEPHQPASIEGISVA